MQCILKMLVEDVDHAVAKTPQQKQRGNKQERYKQVLTVFRLEHLGELHNTPFPLGYC
jgi:hypothetical protein